jgi:fatty-acyl-CoA synthase
MMGTALYAFPSVGSQTLRALSRHPSRAAFVWDGGSIAYRSAAEVIGRMQKAFINSGLERGHRVAILTANRAEAWCAGVAAQLCAASITWLHSLGSLKDQLDQIEDSEASAASAGASWQRAPQG